MAVYAERTEFAAAFSATKNAVLVAGGLEEGRTAPAPLLLHSIETGSWLELPPPSNHERASRTLSVGMDVSEGLAYVLDLVPQDGFFKGLTLLRLTRYALDGSGAKVMAVWPWSGNARGVHATVLEDGLLALTVVRQNAWQVFRMDARGAALKLKGALAGQGRVVDGPVMGERQPIVPVLQAGLLRYEVLRGERFKGLTACSFLGGAGASEWGPRAHWERELSRSPSRWAGAGERPRLPSIPPRRAAPRGTRRSRPLPARGHHAMPSRSAGSRPPRQASRASAAMPTGRRALRLGGTPSAWFTKRGIRRR